jgi:hypothetical protein
VSTYSPGTLLLRRGHVSASSVGVHRPARPTLRGDHQLILVAKTFVGGTLNDIPNDTFPDLLSIVMNGTNLVAGG